MNAAENPQPDSVETDDRKGLSRREVVKAGVLVGGAVVVAGAIAGTSRVTNAKMDDPTGEGTRRYLTVLENIPSQPNEDVLLRMQRELAVAMAKPVFGMADCLKDAVAK